MTTGASSRARWNARHRAAEAGRVDYAPADWLVEHRDVLASVPGDRALDVACGRGRNALFLAGLGFDVDAVDVSDTAVAAVRRRAAQSAGAVTAVRADLESDPLPRPPYAVVVNVDYLQRSLFATLRDALTSGGVLVFETFAAGHPRMNPAYTLAPGELLRAFAGLDVLDHREAGGRAGIVARQS